MFLHLSVCSQGEGGAVMSLPVMDSTCPSQDSTSLPSQGSTSPPHRSTSGRYTSYWNAFLLPLANEVWGKVMFLQLCVILFTGGLASQHASQVTWPGWSASSGVVRIQGGLHPGEFCILRVCIQGGVGQTPEHYRIRSISRRYAFLLLPATKLGQGYVFKHVCDSVHRGWYPSMHCRWYPSMPCSRSPGGVVSQHALQVSRPTPRAEVEGSSQGRSPGPHQGVGVLQAHTQGVSRPTWVVCRPTPIRSPGPHPGGSPGLNSGGVSQHALR